MITRVAYDPSYDNDAEDNECMFRGGRLGTELDVTRHSSRDARD